MVKIDLKICLRTEASRLKLTALYEISIDLDSSGRPFVLKERLRQRRKNQKHGRPFSFLVLNNGMGIVWKGDQDGRQIDDDRFCIAIEEGEAWFLGDIPAIKAAYPKAKDAVLNSYTNDSIVGTWEKLADAIYPGGAAVLTSKGWQSIGAEKSTWAEKISPHMNIHQNNSPSFCYFRRNILDLLESGS